MESQQWEAASLAFSDILYQIGFIVCNIARISPVY
jgi:hypothetical protein